MLGNFVVCRSFFKSSFSKNLLRTTIRVPNSFGDQNHASVLSAWSGSKLFEKVCRKQLKIT